MDNFDPYNVFLAIATNIPQRLKTGFVLQGHMCELFILISKQKFKSSPLLLSAGICNKMYST